MLRTSSLCAAADAYQCKSQRRVAVAVPVAHAAGFCDESLIAKIDEMELSIYGEPYFDTD